MSSLRHPPIFNPNGGDSYSDWKRDVEVWRNYTVDIKKRQGPAVYLSLEGDAREAIRAIAIEDLTKDDGFETIIKELDEVFLKDETTRAFCAVKDFVEYRRQSGQNFPKFLLEFNNKYRELKKFKMTLVDGVLAYFLLVAANLSAEHERLVRATSQLSYDDIKDKLQKIFGEFADGEEESNSGILPVKGEDCLYTKGYQRGKWRGNSAVRGVGASRGRGGRGGQVRFAGNPMGPDGAVMRCHECESTKHFVSECPHKKKTDFRLEEAKMTVHVTLVTGADGTEQRQKFGWFSWERNSRLCLYQDSSWESLGR